MGKEMKSEIKLQAEIYQHCWNEYPETRRCLFHVPNGGSRNPVEAMQLKASGLTPGVPDLLFIWKGSVYAFELKTLIGVLSPVQVKVHNAWLAQGVTVYIIRTFEGFMEIFKSILNK